MSETLVATESAPAPQTVRPPADPPGPRDPRRWVALACALTGLFMVLLDVSIVNVAIPAIRTNLGANNADIQFVVAGYGLAYAVTLITGGRLGDIHGRRRLFVTGMAGFVLASALCGLAQTAVMLDLSRVLQGLMAALMYPQVFSMIQVSFRPDERARVFGIVGATIGIATIAGPLVGGLIIRDDLTGGSWRWIFLVNVPIGIVSLIAALRVVTESRAPNATRLDVVGVGIATTALLLLVYPLVEGQVAGWPAWTFVCIGLSPLVFAAFLLYERALPSSRFPLVQLSMFSIPSFRVGVVVSAVMIAGVPSFFFVFALMLQVGLGFSALHAGLTTVPWSVGTAFASVMSTRLAPRLGKWMLVLGASLLVAGMVGIIVTLRLRGVAVTTYDLVPAMVISGLGLGTVVAPLLTVVLAGVPPRDAGSASGVLATFQQLGGAVGVAVVGVVFFSLLSGRAPSAVADTTPDLRTQLAIAHAPTPAAAAAVSTFTRCFEAQAASTDPMQPAAGCPPTSGRPSTSVGLALHDAAASAGAHDFVDSVERVLGFQIGFWTLTGLLSLLLPRGRAGSPARAR